MAPLALKSALFDNPTTAIRKGDSIYAVSIKLGVAEDDRSSTAYEIVRVDRDSGKIAYTAV